MPFLDIRPGQVDIQLRRTLSRMPQDLLEDGRGATGFDPKRSSGEAEEVGEVDSWRCPDSRDGIPKAPESVLFQINRSVPVMVRAFCSPLSSTARQTSERSDMGTEHGAKCKKCGHSFGVSEGGGFVFHMLHCDRCGNIGLFCQSICRGPPERGFVVGVSSIRCSFCRIVFEKNIELTQAGHLCGALKSRQNVDQGTQRRQNCKKTFAIRQTMS